MLPVANSSAVLTKFTSGLLKPRARKYAKTANKIVINNVNPKVVNNVSLSSFLDKFRFPEASFLAKIISSFTEVSSITCRRLYASKIGMRSLLSRPKRILLSFSQALFCCCIFCDFSCIFGLSECFNKPSDAFISVE